MSTTFSNLAAGADWHCSGTSNRGIPARRCGARGDQASPNRSDGYSVAPSFNDLPRRGWSTCHKSCKSRVCGPQRQSVSLQNMKRTPAHWQSALLAYSATSASRSRTAKAEIGLCKTQCLLQCQALMTYHDLFRVLQLLWRVLARSTKASQS